MAGNYVLIERIELNASAASVTFSSIPQTGYTDLKVVVSARTDGNNRTGYLSLNGDTTDANYSQRSVYGDGSIAQSGSGSNRFMWYMNYASDTASTFGNTELYFPNYSSTSANKSISIDSVQETNATQTYAYLVAGLRNNTAAISSITFSPFNGNFVANSTFSLYGLAAVGSTPAIAPKASGGNITTDGTYWYHTFLASGTFTPQLALSCDVLTIAGGGAGGRGGGGAGGLVYASAQTVAASAQTVTIGGGGAQRTTDGGGLSNPGSNSQFASLTAAVGGGAAAGYSVNGGNGGSGGGAGWGGGGGYSGGTATSGQGSNGGGNGNGDGAGGGGGAGGAGATGATGAPGVGGVGSSTYSSWGLATNTGQLVSSTYYYAGGGGGSANTSAPNAAGGNGGGGTGRSSSGSTPSAGTANTGGGGGGGSGSTAIAGGAGGSGIVIIRYTIA